MLSQQLLWLVSSVVFPVSATECNSTPISIPIQDVQVLPEVQGSFMTGLRAQIGSPAQDILLLPWAELNNTWIYDYEPDCDPTVIWNDLICQVRRGNYFYENDSRTFDKKTNIFEAGGATQEENDQIGQELGIPDLISQSLLGTDVFNTSSTNLTDFPIGIPRSRWDHGYTTLHALGLGRNSTFLNYLVGTGQIASHVWSIFWGRMWTTNWLDGSVVFGGYDSNLVLGDAYTDKLNYDKDEGCFTGMKVTVTDLLLNKRNGEDVSIAPTYFALACCIVPQRQMLLEAPSIVRENFESKTGMSNIGPSFGLHWSATQYVATEVYDGDLTIRLSSGLSIRVPNNQLLVPYVEIARDGTRVSNDSLVDLLINDIGGNTTATLGRYFLTAAYLMVDHDANEFTLWKANPSTGNPNLIPVIGESTDPSCTSVGSGDGSGGGSTSNPSTATADSSPSISTGAVVGIAVGSVAGLTAVAIAVFLILRRRRKRLAAQAGAQPVGPSDNRTDEHAKPNVLTEMPDGSVPPEMVGSDLYPEMAGSDLRPEGHRESGLQQSPFAAEIPVFELDGCGRAS